MIDLLICEDRPVVLMGLKKITEGLDLPLGEIYLAEDGGQALRLFSEHSSVGLVMTDIQLPGFDGLELLRRMQQLRSDFQAVIISGHNDFQYARTAIQLGIEDYLLKPVDPKELRSALIRCIDNLTRHVSQKQILSSILLDQIKEVWGDSLPEDAAALLLSAEDRFFRAASFGVLAFHLAGATDVPLRNAIEQVECFLAQSFSHFLVFPIFEQAFCAIVNLSGPEEGHFSGLVPLTEGFLQAYRASGAAQLFCGTAPKVSSIFQLNEAALQAEGALCGRFSPGPKRERSFSWKPPSPVSLKDRSQVFQHCDTLCSGLRLPEIPVVEKGADALFSSFFSFPHLLQTLPACLRRIELFIQQELGEGEERSPSLIHALSRSDTLEELKENVKRELLDFCRRRLKSRMATQDAVTQALEYMEINYQKPLTLTVLANVVSLNYTYFSNIFKTKMGVSVIGYLQNLRIQKAKELLISTDDKIREIAHKTGFTDERYFEKLFKRCEGVTPSEYRESLASFTSGEREEK